MARRLAVITAIVLACAACATTEQVVSVERADRTVTGDTGESGDLFDEATPTRVDEPPTDDTLPSTDDPGSTDAPPTPDDPSSTDPELPDEPAVTNAVDPVVTDPDAIDFGADKPERPYDDFLLAAVADIDAWFADEFPDAFGQEWEPLEGAVYAGYPERRDDLPGCGEATTSYEDLQQFVAFYCPFGDFIIYDDGDDPIRLPGGVEIPPILFTLAREFGPATIGIVLAHEYGHAVQLRTGTLERNLPTVTTEQQADCIAGAWAGRAAAGQAPGVPFDDSDVRAGLISMITVQDPVGVDPTGPGGHGSGFDRVGAFQVGFNDGLARCAELIDDPLPLTPLQFLGPSDFENQGNAPFGFDEDSGELFSFLVPDLNLLYDNDLDAEFPDFEPLQLTPTQSESEVDCADPIGDYATGIVLCAASGIVYLNEPIAFELYQDFGDFGPGYLLGITWAEAAQISAGSDLDGEQRALRNDCLTGNWVRTVTPELDENGDLIVVTDPDTGLSQVQLPEPRDPERGASISPNDLTEAIQTAILIGDEFTEDDVRGSAFEKIDAFRRGALDGLDACG